MIGAATAARWSALAIAAAAVLDPAVPLPTRARPAVRVVGGPVDLKAAVTRQIRDAGFIVDGAAKESATVLVGDAPSTAHGALSTEPRALSTEPRALSTEPRALSTEHSALSTWALDTTPHSPNVAILRAIGPATRFPEQAVEVRVTVEARGLAGQVSEIVLEDAGIAVASSRHEWKAVRERWHAAIHYLPPGASGGRLRVRIAGMPGETSTADNAADVGVPPLRGPIRTLVVEAGVTWPAMFARRALEGQPAFAVAASQRASTRITTRAGAPPPALTQAALAPFEVVLVGGSGNLTAADVEALRSFVESRGGVVVLIPDRRETDRSLRLLGDVLLEPRTLESPVTLSTTASNPGAKTAPNLLEGPAPSGLKVTELLVAQRTPPGSTTLAATESGEAVVFSVRRGAGAVVFSGALDAWRHRALDDEGFSRFWRRAIAAAAVSVPPAVEVTVEPSLVAAGASTRVRARLRATELSPDASFDVETVTARAISPAARVDTPVRLWPTAEPGVYEGEWRPPAPGDYNIAVTIGARRGDAAITMAPAVARGSASDPEGLALIARASGGQVFPADQPAALVAAMAAAFPARTATRATRPMRSPWWVVPFAGLLCAEWAMRRRHGRP
jgi:hypothetical protein